MVRSRPSCNISRLGTILSFGPNLSEHWFMTRYCPVNGSGFLRPAQVSHPSPACCANPRPMRTTTRLLLPIPAAKWAS
ncbi:UNVERIFIED_CONTAM: hypothetical protein GTU68_050350 [Idotea baltica]|nr:hypothetical protein [Idotea baltica]